MPGFWQRQFQREWTVAQRVFDLTFGAIVPIVCVVFDPVVFTPQGIARSNILYSYRLFAYTEVAIGVTTLVYFLLTGRSSILIASCFIAGAIFSLCLGVLIFPLAVLGLFVVIGIFGFTPFLSGFVFCRNAIRCRLKLTHVSTLRFMSSALVVVLLVIGLPFGTQIAANRAVHKAMHALTSGSDEEAIHAIQTLRRLRYVADADPIVFHFEVEKDPKRRELLSDAFHAMTGKKIETRLEELSD